MSPLLRAFDDVKGSKERLGQGQGWKPATEGLGGQLLRINPQRRDVHLKPDAPFRLDSGGAFKADVESI